MADPTERLRVEIETIARSDSPSVTFGANSLEGLPHAATVWFAPTEDLSLLTFSAPSRKHCQNIDACIQAGVPARVAGGMRAEQQKKSQDCHGVTFEGIANHLTDPREIDKAIGRFLMYETFEEDELEKYLHHPEPEVPAHGIYVLEPTLWTVFDGRLGPANPERLVHLPWALVQ